MTTSTAVWVDGPRIYPMFGVNERTIREAANDGEIERRYIGRKPLYSAESINEWIKNHSDAKAS